MTKNEAGDLTLRDFLANHTTSYLASELGVSLTTVSNWRAGRSRPARQYWVRLAEVLDLSNDELSYYLDQTLNSRISSEFDPVAKRIAELSPQARRMVMASLVTAENIDDLNQEGDTNA